MTTPTISCAVVAHPARTASALALTTALDLVGPTICMMDNDNIGAVANHRRAWRSHDLTKDWCLVVEDDAILCTDFPTRLDDALFTAPTDVVSLYSGLNYPTHRVRRAALARGEAERNNRDHFILDTMDHAVAIAVRTKLVASLGFHLNTDDQPTDDAITTWAQTTGHQVTYTHPSLVDHADGPTLITHPDGVRRTLPRTAARFAG